MGESVDQARPQGEVRRERPPFALVPEALLTDEAVSKASGHAVRVYALLDRHADRNGRCWPGRERLAERLGLSVASVDRAMAALRDAGWLSVQRRGLSQTNVYYLHQRPASTGASAESAPVRTTESAPVPNKREPVEREPGTTARTGALVLADGFDTWWQQYPRKVSKPAARKAYAKALRGGATADDVLAGLLPWCAYWHARGEPEFVPHPATWLNGERWNDAPPEHARRGQGALGVLDVLDGMVDEVHATASAPVGLPAARKALASGATEATARDSAAAQSGGDDEAE